MWLTPLNAAISVRNTCGSFASFFDRLPVVVDAATREAAEAQLAVMATPFRPEALRIGADRMMALLNPDGQFSDADQARRRGLTIGPRGFDGMSAISGLLDPETRAYLDAPPQTWVRITDYPSPSSSPPHSKSSKTAPESRSPAPAPAYPYAI
ncbi:Conserved protein of uncharacterised function possible rep13e12 repeat protein [Mycobacteroides abscessus]|nr:Conserved protein of uncharacterised function possible rep13e12 repeat protein [Mycobacteroides abscessus]SKK57264.1 Conserved protein of uncharacterised function possible rep13e12 repeat protein [Mycobacteroides abscessus subsp. massiliense]CPW69559.1 Conserved protein of uncharacterised function possible rep13e12 repeat protein [Mycobacteroides abscessus]CPW84446.1 Conserved protein of uncharacterised function possible rep13e12 repeat protein [Mycobacteroides abscessus]CQA07691.1 Conserved